MIDRSKIDKSIAPKKAQIMYKAPEEAYWTRGTYWISNL